MADEPSSHTNAASQTSTGVWLRGLPGQGHQRGRLPQSSMQVEGSTVDCSPACQEPLLVCVLCPNPESPPPALDSTLASQGLPIPTGLPSTLTNQWSVVSQPPWASLMQSAFYKGTAALRSGSPAPPPASPRRSHRPTQRVGHLPVRFRSSFLHQPGGRRREGLPALLRGASRPTAPPRGRGRSHRVVRRM